MSKRKATAIKKNVGKKIMFFQAFKNYVEICVGLSSIHGLNHLIAKRTTSEKVLWTVFIIIALYGYITLAHETWHRYQVNPTVISLELDRQNWNITFFTATICPILKEETIDYYIANNYKNITDDDHIELKQFFLNLYDTPFRNFQFIKDFDKIKKEDYLSILNELTDDFSPDFTSTNSMIGIPIKVVTEFGICYAYNSQIANYSSIGYWSENRWDIIDNSDELLRVTAVMGTVSITASNFDHASNFILHSFNDAVDLGSRKIFTKSRGITQITLGVVNLWTTDDVIKLSPSQRNCRLHHESNLKHSPVYSYTSCRIECRITLCLKYCNCIPYFYRQLDGEELCDPEGMRCLSRHTDELEYLYDSKHNKTLCDCMPNCNIDRYFLQSIEAGDWLFGSSVQWSLRDFPKLQFRRDLIFGIIDVLINVGGLAGLFLGCGILSFVEIFYFLTLKLFWYVYDNNHKNKR